MAKSRHFYAAFILIFIGTVALMFNTPLFKMFFAVLKYWPLILVYIGIDLIVRYFWE